MLRAVVLLRVRWTPRYTKYYSIYNSLLTAIFSICKQSELREENDRDNGVSPNKCCKTNTYSRGVAWYCSLYKNAGMSHSDAQCQDKAEMAKKAMSGSVADQAKQVRKYKKEYKAVHKKLQIMKKRHK